MTTEEKFNAAVNVIRNLPKNGAYQPSHDLKLRFYGYFKQATDGPCCGPKPAFWDIVGRTKYDAWKKLGNMSKVEAMENYVEELKKIVETMSYNDNVGMFLGSLGNFYDNVPVEDIEMLLGPVIERVKARPGSPLQNSPIDSRETSPARIRRNLADKTNISSLETSPISTTSPSPQSPDTDDENEEFIDTVETTPNASRKIFKIDSAPSAKGCEIFDGRNSFEKIERETGNLKANGFAARNSTHNGKISRSNGFVDFDDDSDGTGFGYPRTKSRAERESPNFGKRRTMKQNGGSRCGPDVSESLRESILHLQKDLDGITERVRNLEASEMMAMSRVGTTSKNSKVFFLERFFPEISRTTFLFIVVWPFFAHFLMKFSQLKNKRNFLSSLDKSRLKSEAGRSDYNLHRRPFIVQPGRCLQSFTLSYQVLGDLFIAIDRNAPE